MGRPNSQAPKIQDAGSKIQDKPEDDKKFGSGLSSAPSSAVALLRRVEASAAEEAKPVNGEVLG